MTSKDKMYFKWFLIVPILINCIEAQYQQYHPYYNNPANYHRRAHEFRKIFSNLNSRLEDFKDCFVSILTQEPYLDVGIFDFPIHLKDVSSVDSENKGPLRPFDLRRYGNCDLTAVLFTNLTTLDNDTFVDTWSQFFPTGNKYFMVEHGPWTFWPEIFILAGMNPESWKTLYRNYFSELQDFQMSYNFVELYVLFGVEGPRVNSLSEVRIVDIAYHCRFCYYDRNFRPLDPVPCPEAPSCRLAMEQTVNNLTFGGRTVIGLYEYRRSGLTFLHEAKSRIRRGFTFSITPTSFLNYNRIVVVKTVGTSTEYHSILLAILFEHIPPKMADILEAMDFIELWKNVQDFTYGKAQLLHSSSKAFSFHEMSSFNFLTCDGLSKGPNIRIYEEPFETSVWYILIGTILVISTVLMISKFLLVRLEGSDSGQQVGAQPSKPSRRSSGSRPQFWNPIALNSFYFYTLSTVLENNFGKAGKLPGNQSFINLSKLFPALLAIISIVLGNSYKGIITAKIISPVQTSIPWSKIEELANFRFIVLTHEQRLLGEFLRQNKRPEEYKYYSKLGDEIDFMIRWHWMNYVTMEDSKYWTDILNRTKGVIKPEDAAAELSTCKKIAFIGTEPEITHIQTYRDTSAGVYIAGKDKFLPSMIFWQFPNSFGKYLRARMNSLISSGIYSFWEGLQSHVFLKDIDPNLKLATVCKSLELNSNLLPIFQLGGVLQGLATVFFVLEVIVHFIRSRPQKNYERKIGNMRIN